MSKFVHLHVHTHYSLLDGANKVPDLVKRTKALGMESIAISDHGCLYGAVEFYNECRKENIKPIIGIEAYMAPGDRRERTTPGGNAGEAAFHLLLLAQNLEGYKNLLKLSSISYREGFYYKPRIDKEILRQFSKGLICTSACLGGEVASALMKRDMKSAKQTAETYLEIFGPDRFFIEVQSHIKEQNEVNPELVELAKKIGVGVVGTNDVHFLQKEDHHAHDVLCCISMGKLLTDEGRLKYPTQLYLKSADEMEQAVGKYDGAMDNTVRIAEMCNVELDFTKRFAPVYKVPTDKLKSGTGFQPVSGHGLKTHATQKDEQYLRQLCDEGLEWRYGTKDVSQDIRDRLEKEITIIAMKNFCSYFLIVWDFCNYARENGIPVGARGSGVGTMVGYLLGLCNVDPIKYGLLFERFMDPSRNEMPDIDIDICQEGRGKVIEYVRNKYGHVAQIITFGTLAAKAACKDVGRVLGVPLAEIDRLTKLIPGVPGMTLEKAISQVPDLKDLINENPKIKEVVDLAKKLEGMCRNAGVHAAGVIIADQPLDEVIPLCKDKDGNVLTQFEGPIAEKCGLLKMDFLGLRTLTTLQRSIDLARESGHLPKDFDIEKIDFTDRKVLDLFCRGETKGIFQFESGGMQDLLMKMQPDRLEDLIAANALYRPGPMELIPLYCNLKHGREQVKPVHPIMDEILKETYGIMVYQEQVMQIFNQLGGIELSNAYKLIKAISKKTADVIAKFKPEFMKGATSKGVSKDKAEEIFELILKFGGYGFNKSHSTRYAIIAFQTAYMKTYHPVEYMSAVLTFEMGSTDKVVEYIDECRRMTLLNGSHGIKVLPPDVNISEKDFTPVYVGERDGETKRRRDEVKRRDDSTRLSVSASPAAEGVIRFGLCAVRGVGEKAVESIIEERIAHGEFVSLYDFCERVDLRSVQRSTIEALVKCGAFSGFNARRSQLLFVLDRAVEMGTQNQNDKRSGQFNMFASLAAPTNTTRRVAESLPDVDEIPAADLLKFEKEFLGFYLTSHPLSVHQQTIERYTTHTTKEALTCSEGTEVMIGGMIASVKSKVAKTGRSAGQRWAIVELEDLDGKLEGMLFAEPYADLLKRYPDLVKAESICFVRGNVDRKRETPCLVIFDIIPITEAPSKLTTAVALKLTQGRHVPDAFGQIASLLSKHRGNCELYAQVELADSRKVVLRAHKDFFVRPTSDLVHDIDAVLGDGTVQLFGDGTKRKKRIEQAKLFQEEQVATEVIAPDAVIAEMDAEMVAAE